MTGLMNLTRATICGVYKYTGAMRLHEALSRWTGQQFLSIILFHRVTDLIPEDGLTVSPARFQQICSLLANRFRVVPLGEIFRILRSGEPMPPRTLAITFDDSYRTNLDAAHVLADHGLPATFFVPTAYIGTDRMFDWDRGLPSMPHLSWNELRQMVRLGFEIGSHTVTHANLGVVNPEQARNEMAMSRRVLEAELGQPARWFAYPFGGVHHLRPEYIPLIAETGYEGGVSAFGGFVRPGMDDRVLPRHAVPYFRSLVHLELFLAGCLHWLYAIKGGTPSEGRMTPWPFGETEHNELPSEHTALPRLSFDPPN